MSTNKGNDTKGDDAKFYDDLPIFGLTNVGVNCWWNSLLQALMSCKYVVRHVIDTTQINDFHKMFRDYLVRALAGSPDPGMSVALLDCLAKNYPQARALASGQQSASEGFVFIVDCLKLDWYFQMRHMLTISCSSCGATTEKYDAGIHYEMFDDSAQLDLSGELSNCIMSEEFVAPGHMCSRCKRQTTTHRRELKLLPEYLTVIFNKYAQKNDRCHPQTLTFMGKDMRPLHYRCVAQAEHSGTLGGGHYWALASRKDTSSRDLAHAHSRLMYSANDSSISKCDMVSTANTYIVFYERG
jgi:ubiquitin C-terminal hydrolase